MPSDPDYLMHKAMSPDRQHLAPGLAANGEWVMVVHESLESLNFVVGHDNVGHYDDALVQAVREFQYGAGLEATGNVDDAFWDALADQLAQLPRQEQHEAPVAHHHQYHQPTSFLEEQVCRDDPHAPPPASAHITGDLAHAEGWLNAYLAHKSGVAAATADEATFYHWADHSPEWQEAYAEYLQAMDDRQPVMWADGSISTRPEHREAARVRSIQRALAVLTGPSFGAIAFGVAKEAGASDDTAAGIGEMVGTGQGMVGGYQKAQQQGATQPRSTAGPNYGEHPR